MSKKNKILIGTLSILLVCAIVAGISYAYWKTTYVATNINKINSSCFSMELTNEKNNIVIESTYPITDDKGKKLTPYSFTITNTCDLFASYTINLEMLDGTTLNSKYIKTMINSEAISNLASLPTKDVTVDGAVESRELFKGSLGAGDSVDYTFRLWMDYDTPLTEESMNKNFQSKITVTSEVSTYSPVENGFTNLAETLLVNEYQTTNVNVAKNKIASKQEVDFSKTAPIIDWQKVENNGTTTIEFRKAAPELLNSYGVTDRVIHLGISEGYTFDSAKGYYSVGSFKWVDATTFDFSTKDYYVCITGYGITPDNKISGHDSAWCPTLNKIKGLVSTTRYEDMIVLPNGEKLPAVGYKLEVEQLSALEVGNDKSDKGLYQAEDDYGTSYYYRGSVNNNYVKFAGIYWRVIRINGDGSIRLLFDAKKGSTLNKMSYISTTAFNKNAGDPTYVGYMYSNTLNTSYNDTISNDNDSTIKVKLDEWYKMNIEDKGYSSYIADSGFCNDRSISSGNGYSNNTVTRYNTYARSSSSQPTLKCPNVDNDLFTLSTNSIGNKKLTYPIGLYTLDEITFAGMKHGYRNQLSYIYSGYQNWTMSPFAFIDSKSAVNYVMSNDLGMSTHLVNVNDYFYPVINLKANTEITSGIGTINDPFIIK